MMRLSNYFSSSLWKANPIAIIPVPTASNIRPINNNIFRPNRVIMSVVKNVATNLTAIMRVDISIATSVDVAWFKIGPQYILIAFTPDSCCIAATYIAIAMANLLIPFNSSFCSVITESSILSFKIYNCLKSFFFSSSTYSTYSGL
jgi:hypothetical protein